MKRTLIAALALAAGLAGCGGNEEPKTDPPPTSSPTASTTPTPTATAAAGGPPADWELKFSPSELSAAQEAMKRWEKFRRLSAEIYRQGKFTPGAKATLQEYDFWWQRNIVVLGETYDKGGLRREESVEALWSYVDSVRLNKDGTGAVTIVQCTNYEPLRYSRNGKPVDIKKPKHLVTPLHITMTKPDVEHGWMHQETKLKDKQPCAPE